MTEEPSKQSETGLPSAKRGRRWWVRRWWLIMTLLVVGYFVGHMALNRMVQSKVRSSTENSLYQATELERATLNLWTGEIDIKAMSVGNPKGFTEPVFLRLEQGKVKVALGSWWEEPAQVPEVELQGLQIVVEQNMLTNNALAVIANIREQNKLQPHEKSHRYVVGKIVLRNSKLRLKINTLGGFSTENKIIDLPEVSWQGEPGKAYRIEDMAAHLMGKLAEQASEAPQLEARWKFLLRSVGKLDHP